MAEAASWNSVVSILMVMYPSKVSTVMSWTEMFFGFGFMIGKLVFDSTINCAFKVMKTSIPLVIK